MYLFAKSNKLKECGFNDNLAYSVRRMMKALNFIELDRVLIFDIVQNEDFINYYSRNKLTIEKGEMLLLKALSNSIDSSTEINPS